MKRIIAAVLLMLGGGQAFAQDAPKLYTVASPFDRYTHYVVTGRFTGAVPLGAFSKDYIDKTSFQNASISLEWVFRNAPVSIGGEIGSYYFEKRLPRTVYDNGDETISAVQTRTLSQYPVEVFANYLLLPKTSSVQPYVQVSGGISILDHTVYYGSLSSQNQKVAPRYGIGVGSRFLFRKDGSFGADVRVKYSGTAYKFEEITKGISSVNGSIGLFYRWW
ncbi:hypothetical protein [Dyadobacter sandarakinus]|uniref:Outer membrane protein beta-barrel domain-containing protein n=1 Tax=Dyadobacter sandarakinus TaxID=2747268 RepID=A0ABX7IF57_9BACT|nr:hypothetical protein [Dyadobacter sandarakinus]QRR03723.1 hypothetical protein HWI92_23815 [Dyadobacter sandarakinus]